MKNRNKEATVPRHSHCVVCGRSILEKETICSDECKDEYEVLMKKQNRLRLMAFLPMIITALMILVLFFVFGRN